ncbi:TonB-dependent siderophore receptor [Herbaspirillum autotrophicum]|uniref:TonB-dependent siderophore receptor n=1 Tax=Herbaspirillum autotrophicum TaxID=180195 RepID=UPI0009FAC67F|nr:TonB-dependent siderophore receptor [Herbaspirillum autotrophicum]
MRKTDHSRRTLSIGLNRSDKRPPPLTVHLSGMVLACAAACTVMGGLQQAHAQSLNASPALALERQFSVPAQPLGQSINALARQAGVAISVDAALVADKTAPAVQGSMTLGQALDKALAGSGLAATASGSAIAIGMPGKTGAGLLPTLTINAARDTADGPVNGYVARRSATATKTDTPLTEIPQSISIIGRAEMEARGTQDMMDIVAQTPGVTVNTYGADNRGWEYISLRGFNAYSGNFRDGLPQTPFIPVYSMTETYGLERVEVLRGPASVMFGQGDVGGVVNRISKMPVAERIREIEVQYGSFDRKQLAFDVGDAFDSSGELSYRLVGVALDSNDQDRYPDGARINRTRYSLSPSLRWQPSAATSLTVLTEFLKNDSGEDPYYAIAGDGTLTNIKMGDHSFSKFRHEQASVGYQLEHAFNDSWKLRQNFRYSDVKLKRNVVWVDELQADGHTYSRIARTWNDRLRQTSLDTQLHGKLPGTIASQTLLFGIDWNYNQGNAYRFKGPAPDLDLLNPIYGLGIPTPQTPIANYAQTTSQIGLYAQDQIKLFERLIVTLGGRQDYVRTATDDALNSTRKVQNDSVFSGRIGLSYLLGNGWAPYASYGESFLPSIGVDSNNNPFKPSRGKQTELGIKFQPENSRSLFTAAVFDLTKTNVITYDNITGDARQIGKQRTRGIELEAKAEIVRNLNVIASFTKMNMKVLESADSTEAGKVPATVPNRTASLWLDYEISGGLGIGGGVNYVGERQNDEANTSVEGGFSLFSAMMRYEHGPWMLRLNASNLLNKGYNTICYHGECYRGTERAVTATVKYRF